MTIQCKGIAHTGAQCGRFIKHGEYCKRHISQAEGTFTHTNESDDDNDSVVSTKEPVVAAVEPVVAAVEAVEPVVAAVEPVVAAVEPVVAAVESTYSGGADDTIHTHNHEVEHNGFIFQMTTTTTSSPEDYSDMPPLEEAENYDDMPPLEELPPLEEKDDPSSPVNPNSVWFYLTLGIAVAAASVSLFGMSFKQEQ